MKNIIDIINNVCLQLARFLTNSLKQYAIAIIIDEYIGIIYLVSIYGAFNTIVNK